MPFIRKSAALQGVFPILLIAGMVFISRLGLLAQRDTIRTGVDLVVVPASVKDGDGRFVYDLEQRDFVILEDGRPQQIERFSIDPAPLAVAVLVDTAIGGTALRRFSGAIVALSSAFTPMDEVEIYRFDNFLTKLSDFTSKDAKAELKRFLAIDHRYPGRRNIHIR